MDNIEQSIEQKLNSSLSTDLEYGAVGIYKILMHFLRLFVLGVIVYIVVTYIPSTPLNSTNKIWISLMVVFMYGIWSYIKYILNPMKGYLCNKLC